MKRLVAVGVLIAGLAACHRGPRAVVFARIDAERAGPGADAFAQRAPATWARAEQLRKAAEQAQARGDTVGAELLGERALATYVLARETGRHSLALIRSEKIRARRAELEERANADRSALEEIEADLVVLETEIVVRNEALEPAASSPTAGPREAARWTVVRSNLAAAQVLCDAARLLDEHAAGVEEAVALLSDVASIAKNRPAPIDASNRVRALCLSALTRAKNVAAKSGGVRGEALASELEAAGFVPVRDERGLVLTWSQNDPDKAPFQGDHLSSRGRSRLEEVARLIDGHAPFRMLLVVHAAGTADERRDRARASAATQTAAAVLGTRVSASSAGVHLPLHDTRDPKGRAANERLEIILVGD